MSNEPILQPATLPQGNKPRVNIIENGIITNPIKETYLHSGPNRKTRRKVLQKNRWMGNHKGTQLSVYKTHKYHKTIQNIMVGDNIKTIQHYI